MCTRGISLKLWIRHKEEPTLSYQEFPRKKFWRCPRGKCCFSPSALGGYPILRQAHLSDFKRFQMISAENWCSLPENSMKLIRALRPVVWTCQMTLKDMDLTSDNEGSSLVIGTGVTLMNDWGKYSDHPPFRLNPPRNHAFNSLIGHF